MNNLALQMYSIKELAEKDFFGTLENVANIGYQGVEFAGYFDFKPSELKKKLDEVGLKAAGSHVGMDILVNKLDEAIEYANIIENPYIICPWIEGSAVETIDACKRTGEQFNEIGFKCKKNGARFGYHNHAFEFEKVEDKYKLDLLMEYTQPELMFMELDTFWVEYSGLKAMDWIEKYKERCLIVHIKEMKSLEDKVNTEIGKGIIDFKSIIALGQKYGVKWNTVEQERFEIDQYQSIAESLDYLKKI